MLDVLGQVDRVAVEHEVVGRAVRPACSPWPSRSRGRTGPTGRCRPRSGGRSGRTTTSPAPAASSTRPAAGRTTCRPSSRRTRGSPAGGRSASLACRGRVGEEGRRPRRPGAGCRSRRGRRGGGTRRRRRRATAGCPAPGAWPGSSRRSGCAAGAAAKTCGIDRRSRTATVTVDELHEAGVPDGDGGLAVPLDLHAARLVDLGDGLVGAGELGPAGHVLDAAVGERRLDEDLLRVARLQPHGGGVGGRAATIVGSSARGAGCPRRSSRRARGIRASRGRTARRRRARWRRSA